MFWNLLLAHLLADYPLQTRWLLAAKARPWGLGVHVLIHLLTSLLLVGDRRWSLLAPLAALAASHLITDAAKYRLAAARPQWVTIPYFADQLLHLIWVALASRWAAQSLGQENMLLTPAWLILASGYLLATHVWFVTERVCTPEGTSYAQELEASFWPRMLARAGLLTLALGLTGGFRGAALAGLAWLPYASGAHRLRAALTDLLVAAIAALLISLALPRFSS